MVTLLLAAALAAAPVAPAPPPLDQVLAEAAVAGTPVLVDVITTWCAPCVTMAAKVFPDPRVQRALEGVRFVAYDAERGPGVAVARRFDITIYPTVLLLSPDGVVAGQLESQTAEELVEELEALKPLARVRLSETLSPDAPAAAWLLAGLAAAEKEPARALAAFARAARADPQDAAGIASRAAVAAIPLQAKRGAELARAKAMSDVVMAWPASPSAASTLLQLAQWVRKAQLDEALLDAPRAAVVKAAPRLDDPGVAHELAALLLSLKDVAGAREVAKRLQALAPEDALALDTVAEVAFQAGEREEAVALSRRAVAAAREADRAELEANLRRFQTERPRLPALEPQPYEWPAGDRGRALDEQVLAVRLKDACPGPTVTAQVVVRLYLGQGARVRRAVAFDPLAPRPLLRCLERSAVGADATALGGDEAVDVRVRYQGAAR